MSKPVDDWRSVPEWIGATPDTPIPKRVKMRVFQRYDGICYLTGRKIRAGDEWEAEHVQAIINGGQNRESNLKPALKEPHKEKTKKDLETKSKTARMFAKHHGTWPKSKNPIRSRGFPKRGEA